MNANQAQGKRNNVYRDGVMIKAQQIVGGVSKPPTAAEVDTEKVFGNKAIGPTYNMLRPEVKTCLDKVMY